MFKKILGLTLISISLFAKIDSTKITEYKDGKFVIEKIKYLNFNNLDLSDKRKKDLNQFKLFFNDLKSPIFIANNIKEVNSLSIFNPPHTIIYSANNYKNRKIYSKNAIGIAYTSNEYFKVKRFTLEDEKNVFKNNNINGFVINDNVFILINFSDKYYPKNPPKELIKKIKNLNFVVKKIRKELQKSKHNIIFIGKFGIPYNKLTNLVKGFKPIIKEGNEFILQKSKRKHKIYKLANSENVLIFKENKDIFAKIDYNFMLKNYSGKNKTDKFIKKVSKYLPIDIYIKERIFKK